MFLGVYGLCIDPARTVEAQKTACCENDRLGLIDRIRASIQQVFLIGHYGHSIYRSTQDKWPVKSTCQTAVASGICASAVMSVTTSETAVRKITV
jgi:hypothetical protein